MKGKPQKAQIQDYAFIILILSSKHRRPVVLALRAIDLVERCKDEEATPALTYFPF